MCTRHMYMYMTSVGVAQGHAPVRMYTVQSRGEFPSRDKRKEEREEEDREREEERKQEKKREAETETVFIMF